MKQQEKVENGQLVTDRITTKWRRVYLLVMLVQALLLLGFYLIQQKYNI